MYRPNRIGPWPLISLDTRVNGGTASTSSQPINQARIYLADATIRAETASTHLSGLTEATVLLDEHQAFGVAINGSNPHGDNLDAASDPGFIVCVAGSITAYGTAGDAPIVDVVLARSQNATLTAMSSGHNQTTEFMMLPMLSQHTVGNFTVASVNVQAIVGNHNGALAGGTDPIMAAFRIINPTGASKQFEFECSLSIHKYAKDLHVFDPTRT